MSTTYLGEMPARAPTGRSSWLAELRHAARDHFSAHGFPGARHEDWRFTNIAPITGGTFPPAGPSTPRVTASELAPYLYALPCGATLVFVNGRFAPGLSRVGSFPGGVVVGTLGAAMDSHGDRIRQHLGQYASYEKNGFTALNTAFVTDGVFVFVPADVELVDPIHAVYVTDGQAEAAATYPRNLVIVEHGAKAAVIESYVSLGGKRYFTNAVTEAAVGQGARLEHAKIQRESEAAYHVGSTHVYQEQTSQVHSYSVSLGGALCRNNLDLVLGGPGIESQLLGLYMSRGTQEVDNHTSILHAHPNCSTREVYKGVLDGASHAVFNGKVYVTPEAQKTDAKQTNRNLLLSDRAKVDTKPQLEIFADDVKCTHGATVGSLDQLAGFYLKSRGIGPQLSRRILTYAFAAEVLEEIPWETLRLGLEDLVRSRVEVDTRV